MDPAMLSATAALIGSIIGGVSTFSASWLTQHRQVRINLLLQEAAKREKLYAEFVQRQRSRHALCDAPGARCAGSSREFVPAPFRLCVRYRADIAFPSRGEGIPGSHEDVAKGSGNWPHARRRLFDQQMRSDAHALARFPDSVPGETETGETSCR
jgi:hypothetical protein